MKDLHKEAKLSSLKKIKKEMEDLMKSELKGGAVKKVTVASDSKKGLKEGLEKAESMLGDESEEDEDEVSIPKDEFKDEHERLVDVLKSDSKEDDLEEAEEQESELEDLESEEDEDEEEELESEDDIDAEIEKLLALKEKLQSR